MQVDLKKLKPLGIVLILGCSLLALIMCFTVDMGVPKPYESIHDTEYYRQSEENMKELVSELEINVFPNLEGINDYEIDTYNMVLLVYVSEEYAEKARLIFERDFGTELIVVYSEIG